MINKEVDQLHQLLLERNQNKHPEMKRKLIRQRFNKISLCCNKEQTIFYDVKNGGLWAISSLEYQNDDSNLFFVQWKYSGSTHIKKFSQLPFSDKGHSVLLKKILMIINQ